MARKLLDVVAKPFNIGGEVIEITASLGVVSFTEGSDVSDDLIRDAELAEEAAKRAGRNTFQMYSPRLRMRSRDRAISSCGRSSCRSRSSTPMPGVRSSSCFSS